MIPDFVGLVLEVVVLDALRDETSVVVAVLDGMLELLSSKSSSSAKPAELLMLDVALAVPLNEPLELKRMDSEPAAELVVSEAMPSEEMAEVKFIGTSTL